MDIDLFDALNYLTGSMKTGPRLKLCDFYKITDFLNFNDKSIDKIEEYIQLRCSIMNEEQRALYLDEDDIKHPSTFMISPGLRNRLLRGVAIVLQSINNVSFSMEICGNLYGSKFVDNGNKSNSVSEYSNFYELQSSNIEKNMNQKPIHFTKNSQMINPNIPTSNNLNNINSVIKASRVTKNSSTLRKINEISEDNISLSLKSKKTLNTTNIKRKEKSLKTGAAKSTNIQNKLQHKKMDSKITETVMNNCYESIVTDQFLNFENCNLIPKTDFDIEINFNEKSIGNSKCFYICCQCNNKRVKFSFNKDLKPIQTGIKSHNRTHFSTKSSFISTQFRRSLAL